jgi:AcrR family transcriptional regulator
VARTVCQHRLEAILTATSKVVKVRGAQASMAEIAREAGVSKQTLYNRFGSKEALVLALATRRPMAIAATLEAADSFADVEATLYAFARLLLQTCLASDDVAITRLAAVNVGAAPEMATAVYEAGPKKVVRALEVFMVAADAAGQLNCPDPGQAAEFFASMVVGMRQIDRLLGATLESLEPQFEHVAREAALRFVRAYGPA